MLAPIGLSLDPVMGVLSGHLVTIPEGQVVYTFTVRVADGLMRSAERSFALTVTTNRPPYYVTPYEDATEPYDIGSIYDSGRGTFGHLVPMAFLDHESNTGQVVVHSVVDGSLPPGMAMELDGSLRGNTSSVQEDTVYEFTVRAFDGIEDARVRFTVAVRAPIFVDLCNNSHVPGSCKVDDDYTVRARANPPHSTLHTPHSTHTHKPQSTRSCHSHCESRMRAR